MDDLTPEQEATIKDAVARYGCTLGAEESGGACITHWSEWYVDWQCCYRVLLEVAAEARPTQDDVVP